MSDLLKSFLVWLLLLYEKMRKSYFSVKMLFFFLDIFEAYIIYICYPPSEVGDQLTWDSLNRSLGPNKDFWFCKVGVTLGYFGYLGSKSENPLIRTNDIMMSCTNMIWCTGGAGYKVPALFTIVPLFFRNRPLYLIEGPFRKNSRVLPIVPYRGTLFKNTYD